MAEKIIINVPGADGRKEPADINIGTFDNPKSESPIKVPTAEGTKKPFGVSLEIPIIPK